MTVVSEAVEPPPLELRDGRLLTSGGRVLCATVLADSVKQAQPRAYELLQAIHFDGMQYRSDIGHRAVKR